VLYVTHDQTEAMSMSDKIVVINKGVIQQRGTPEEIYKHPANPFVADFLGKVDFFRGKAENGFITIPEMKNQKIPYTGEHTGNVYVAVRPENIVFRENGELSGILEMQYYLGDTTDFRVRIGDSLVRVIADGHAYHSVMKGDPVYLSIREFIVFPDDGSLEETLQIRT
jgi:iron(III) transport system ATP-binding protein